MVLSRLTKITGPGVATDTNWVGNNADFTGVTTTGSSFNIGVTTIHSNLIEAHNIKSTGIITATGGSFSGNVTAVDGTFTGNVSIAGTLTYEDVTNVDSVGIVTAAAVDVDDFLDVGSNIKLGNAGVITATSFVGSGAALTGIDATAIKDSGGNVKIQAQASGAIHSGVSTFQDIDVDGHTNLDNVSIAGVVTATTIKGALEATSASFSSNIDANGDLDVDGHTNLDNVSIAGVTTFAGAISGTTGTFTGAGSVATTATGVLFALGDGGSSGDRVIQFKRATRSTDINIQAVNSGSGATNLLFNQEGGAASFGGALSATTGTFTGADINGDIDVDGHTNLDNVSIAGVTTAAGILDATNTPASIRVAQDIQHKGDADTKITFPAADTISFETGGSERLRIDSSGHISQGGGATPSSTNGNVGLKFGIKSALNNVIIGETTNGSMNGIILESRITGRSGGARCSQVIMGDGVINFETAPSGGAVAERLRITSDGRLFVNSTAVVNTDDFLTIKRPAGNTAVTSMTLDATTSTGSYANALIFTKAKDYYYNGLVFTSSQGHQGGICGKMTTNGGSTPQIDFRVGGSGFNSSDTLAMTITNSNGRVNIGGSVQTANDLNYCRLNVYGQTSQNGTNKNLNLLNVYNYGSGNPGDITGIGLGAAASPDYTKASLAFIRTTSYGRGDLIFCVNSEGNANMVTESDERLRITSSGTVIVKTNGLNLENATATNSRGYSITNAAGTTGWTFGNGITASSHQFVIYDNTAGAARVLIDSSGHFRPGANNTYDLGASGTAWRNLYVNDAHFCNRGHSNSVDGTWGDWTLQEGENDIFMINNRTGKKFAITMREVS